MCTCGLVENTSNGFFISLCVDGIVRQPPGDKLLFNLLHLNTFLGLSDTVQNIVTEKGVEYLGVELKYNSMPLDGKSLCIQVNVMFFINSYTCDDIMTEVFHDGARNNQ